MHFEKWHGIGNDFLIVEEVALAHERDAGFAYLGSWEDGSPRIDAAAVVAVCDRHFGVGADGILVVGSSQSAQARMRIYNADGSMAEMCGNGIRVVARALVESDAVRPGADGTFDIETAGGMMRPSVLGDGRVRVDMGELRDLGIAGVDLDTVDGDLAGVTLSGHVINVGNPHFVVRRTPEGRDLHRLGPPAEVHPHFPDRTNVEFWQVDDAATSQVRMRVWERGVGETLACGTGACAVAFAARAELDLIGIITVELPGGSLDIEFDGNRAFMTGAAHHAWSGELDLAAIVAGMPSE